MSATAPGYDQETGTGGSDIISKRIGTVTAKRITGAFDVRGKNSVSHIKDGWLCRDEQGFLFGVEDADISSLMAVPPALFVDSVIWLANGTAGTPYTATLTPPSNSGATVLSATLQFGYNSTHVTPELTFDATAPSAPVVAGTPGDNNQDYAVYFEVLYVYDNHRNAVQRYAMVIRDA